ISEHVGCVAASSALLGSSLTLKVRRPKRDEYKDGQDSNHSGSCCSRQNIAKRRKETRSFNQSPQDDGSTTALDRRPVRAWRLVGAALRHPAAHYDNRHSQEAPAEASERNTEARRGSKRLPLT